MSAAVPAARETGGTEDGSALVAALILVTVVATLAASLVAFQVVRYRLVGRDAHRLRVHYASEGGLYAALARLRADPTWRPAAEPMPVEGLEETPSVSIRALGLYLQVRAVARHGSAEAAADALIARRAPSALDAAVAFGDTLSELTLAGHTVIRGPVVVSRRGVRTGTLPGRPFTGRVDGEPQIVTGDPLPPFSNALARETLARFASYLDALPDSLAPTFVPAPEYAPYVEAERAYVPTLRAFVAGGGRLTAADTALTRGPVLLLARGTLTLEGPLRLPPGFQVVVRGTLRVIGAVEGEGVVLAADRIEVEGRARIQGQLLGLRALRAGGGARFPYPSVLYVAGDGASTDDRLELSDAVVEGLVAYPAEGAPPGGVGQARLVLGPEAVARGAVYAAHTATISGRVEGSLFVRSLTFYESPATYVNWLSDATVDVEARPRAFLVPPGLGEGRPAYEPLYRAVRVTYGTPPP